MSLTAARTVTRFAPSPTGYLHLGHVHSALEGWSAARREGGLFQLRIEDIDRTRCREEYGAAILEAVQAAADATLEELRSSLAKTGVLVSYGALWRFLARHKITRKKRPRTRASRSGRTS